jgi:Fic family protein
MASSTGRRTGEYVRQPAGYRAFIPTALSLTPPVKLEGRLAALLSKADTELGRLDGCSEALPNPDLFVAMYVNKEAVLSSRIEGTQSSLTDVLKYQAEVARKPGSPSDVGEVVNYVSALNYGLIRLNELPLSLRLLREIHAKLLHDVRGSERGPGEFRRSQNWLGPAGSTIANATFVPPPPGEMNEAMWNLEKFIHQAEPSVMPVLIACALVHSQFETIHPFLDGNGRMGRLLITLMLCWRGVLRRPLLYLSLFFAKRRSEYYDRLQAVRDKGDWEGWLEFFLEGVAEVAADARRKATRILELRERNRTRLVSELGGSASLLRLQDYMYENPFLSLRRASRDLGLAYSTVNNLVSVLQSAGVVEETTGQRRNRVFCYTEYVNLLEED